MLNKHFSNCLKAVTLFYLIMLVGQCYAQVSFNGTVYHSPPQKVWLTDFFGKKIDSAVVSADTQRFVLKTNVLKESLFLVKYEKAGPRESNPFIVLPGEQVEFSFDAEHLDQYPWANVSGSPFTQERIRFYRASLALQQSLKDHQQKYDSIANLNNRRFKREQQALNQKIVRDQNGLDDMALKVLDTTRSIQNSVFAFGLLCRSDLSTAKKRDSLLTVLKDKFPGNKQIQGFQLYMVMPHEQLPENSIIPDIVLNDVDGKRIDLRKIDQKYLLVHFWASWCKPCRVETPEIIRAYNQFNRQGFKVLLVSVDTDLKAWRNAIDADGTAGLINVVDPSGKKYLKEFKIVGIPENLLIDNSGKIIGNNLSMNTLYSKLSSLINMGN